MLPNRIFRWIFYLIEFLVLFILQTVPGIIPAIGGVQPLLLLSAALSVALFEGNVGGMTAGIAAGLLIDFGYGEILGVHAIFLAIFGFLLGSMTMELFRTNLLILMLAGLVVVPAVLTLQWLLFYVWQGYNGAGYVYYTHYIPEMFYTYLLLPLLYGLNRIIALRLSEAAS